MIDSQIARAELTVDAMIESDGLNTTLEYIRHSGWSTLTAVASVIDGGRYGRPDHQSDRASQGPSGVLSGASNPAPADQRRRTFRGLVLREELASIMGRWKDLSGGK